MSLLSRFTKPPQAPPAAGKAFIVYPNSALPEPIKAALKDAAIPSTYGAVSYVWHVPAELAAHYEKEKAWPPFLNVEPDATQWRFHLPAMGFASARVPYSAGGTLVVYTEA